MNPINILPIIIMIVLAAFFLYRPFIVWRNEEYNTKWLYFGFGFFIASVVYAIHVLILLK